MRQGTSVETNDGGLDAFRGDRIYLGADHARNERRTWIVAGLCTAALLAQIGGGLAFHSMALLAGGLHMAAHVAALVVAAAAYGLARRYAQDRRFSFGTGKLGYLAAFANAVVLAAAALAVLVESVERLVDPGHVEFEGALPLAAAALGLTVVCAVILRPGRTRHHHDATGDLNLSVAHFHLTADAAVSVLGMAGSWAGRNLGWTWADPLAGLLGAALIAHFAVSLIRQAGAVLLDMNPSPTLSEEVRGRLETDGAKVIDLHLWRLGPGHHAAIVVLAAASPLPVRDYRARVAGLPGLSHLTIEVRDIEPGALTHSHGSV